jgi:Xaa-Pro aminopeptidase
MKWSEKEIKNHKKATTLLCKIKDKAFQFIKENSDNITEYDVAVFIKSKYKEFGLRSDKEAVIVAFDTNTSFVHYFPRKKTAKKLNKENLIMIDLWARLRESYSPYADITWMGYFGKNISKEIQNVFDVVIKTRNACIQFIKKEITENRLPKGKEVEKYHVDFIKKFGYGDYIDHFVGHSIGFHSPHGKLSGLNPKGNKSILKNIGYTIEPGIYLDGKFGVRSEIDFYINKEKEIIITTEIQDKIEIL